jgi:phage shock protein PspC (stress-responsive transcriptional regulator)
MEKVITIDLNGNAYQLDEAAYDALREYLDLAGVRLTDNPDRAEILKDFEQAIGEKCRRFLGPAKTVVTAAEMRQIVVEMGPVEAGEHAEPGAASHAASGEQPAAGVPPRKHLYRIREGAMWAGVCSGLAAYFGVDVAIVRIIFIVLTAVSFGWGIFGYWMLVFLIPEAQTSDERAAAHGQPPFSAKELIEQARLSAQELIDHAKQAAADFKGTADLTGAEWKRHWRQQRREWRTQHRAWRRQWREKAGDLRSRPQFSPASYAPPPPWTVWLAPIFGMISLAYFVCLLLVIASLINTRGLLGFALPDDIPTWGGILIVVVLFQLVTMPIRALHHASYAAWGRPFGLFAVWDGFFATGITVLVIWLLLQHMTTVENLRDFLRQLPEAARALAHDVTSWLQQITS